MCFCRNCSFTHLFLRFFFSYHFNDSIKRRLNTLSIVVVALFSLRHFLPFVSRSTTQLRRRRSVEILLIMLFVFRSYQFPNTIQQIFQYSKIVYLRWEQFIVHFTEFSGIEKKKMERINIWMKVFHNEIIVHSHTHT